MIIRCRYCKREFDKPSYRNQHEKDAHPPIIKSGNINVRS